VRAGRRGGEVKDVLADEREVELFCYGVITLETDMLAVEQTARR
jgi:hypothetical protein